MRRQNDQKLGDVLKEWLEQSPIRAKIFQARIELIWRDKMGATINQYTTAINLVRKKLYLTVSSAPLRQELAFSREKIRDMINEELGERVVEEVVIN
ncbi:MAG: DUF721 domain-containing protein [Saprospirales bacterium]|nr:DUF721 domain-containing protein [Saprospirales bacterium]MBK6904129.1 DUF721 domain-containing protein [Saprospirales bacterium]MBK7335826.1 DUF721 domain-containing protein [Saprospirales bacterium]